MKHSPRTAWIRDNVVGELILDVGYIGEYETSTVHRAIRKANPGSKVVGVDLKSEHPTEGTGVRGDVFSLPFQKNAFDAVVFAEVLEHLPNPERAIEELHRVVEPGGELYLTTPNSFGLYRYLRRYLLNPSLDPASFLGAVDHRQFFDPLSLSSILAANGFDVSSLSFRNVSGPKIPTLPDFQFLRRFPFNRAGSYICLVATASD